MCHINALKILTYKSVIALLICKLYKMNQNSQISCAENRFDFSVLRPVDKMLIKNRIERRRKLSIMHRERFKLKAAVIAAA